MPTKIGSVIESVTFPPTCVQVVPFCELHPLTTFPLFVIFTQ